MVLLRPANALDGGPSLSRTEGQWTVDQLFKPDMRFALFVRGGTMWLSDQLHRLRNVAIRIARVKMLPRDDVFELVPQKERHLDQPSIRDVGVRIIKSASHGFPVKAFYHSQGFMAVLLQPNGGIFFRYAPEDRGS